MSNDSDLTTQSGSSIPPDDFRRNLVLTRSNDGNLPHIGLVGDTYTILLTGKETARRANSRHSGTHAKLSRFIRSGANHRAIAAPGDNDGLAP